MVGVKILMVITEDFKEEKNVTLEIEQKPFAALQKRWPNNGEIKTSKTQYKLHFWL